MNEEREKRNAQRRQRRRDYRLHRMEERMNRIKDFHGGKIGYKHHHAKREWIGIFIILLGLGWLAKIIWGPVLPEWIFRWPAIMVYFGLALGIASGFRDRRAYILMLIGLGFIANEYVFPQADLKIYIWPLIIILIGVAFILKQRNMRKFHDYMSAHPEEFKDWRCHWKHQTSSSQPASAAPPETETEPVPASAPAATAEPAPPPDSEDWIDITTFLGGTRRTIISKQIKGGEIVNILGGTDLDLSRADIQGTVTLEVNNVMGGIRLAIPPNWQLHFDCTCIMGGTDDKRRSGSSHDQNKLLILTGTILMGGLEVRDIL